jgi:3-hydroxyisobutyrate dehydrogenase-like beta-hydroxyacid dehydrogenase
MTNEPISRVAIIGTGQMGPTIAVATTLAGCSTIRIGRTAELKASKQEHRGVRSWSYGAVICGFSDGLHGVANVGHQWFG